MPDPKPSTSSTPQTPAQPQIKLPPPPQPQIQLPPAPTPAPAAAEFPVDRSNMNTVYANFCQVIGLPEELLLDFGLNASGDQVPTNPVKLTHQVVLNYYTAKRLLNALAFAVNRHENFFGVLEVDVQKRIRTAGLGGPGPLGR